MKSLFRSLLSALRRVFLPKAELVLENAALRQQLDVYGRQTSPPKLRRADRLFWIWLCRHWPRWRSALVIVRPETVLRWHREGYRRYWRYRSKVRVGRPRIPWKHIEFIRQISRENPGWGEDKIALELELKLGVVHSPSTIRRYMVTGGPRPGSTWRKLLTSHADQMIALDFTTQPLWNFSCCYVLVILALHNRRVVHVAVTDSPTLEWVKQQIREATPWDEALRIPIPYGAPNAQAHIERFMGTLKRGCLHHFIFVSRGHLERTSKKFARYYNESRPHQGIHGIPDLGAGRGRVRDGPPPESARLIAEPVLGGLHHDYRLAA